jgi:hypothetical protein
MSESFKIIPDDICIVAKDLTFYLSKQGSDLIFQNEIIKSGYIKTIALCARYYLGNVNSNMFKTSFNTEYFDIKSFLDKKQTHQFDYLKSKLKVNVYSSVNSYIISALTLYKLLKLKIVSEKEIIRLGISAFIEHYTEIYGLYYILDFQSIQYKYIEEEKITW